MEVNRKERIDWTKSYNPKEKKPYDTYVFKKELTNFIPSKPKIKEINQSIYHYFLANKISAKEEALVYVGNSFESSQAGTSKLLDFVQKGGVVFISSYTISQDLLDTLHVNRAYYSAYQANHGIEEEKFAIELTKYREKANFDLLEGASLFDELPKKAIILGNVQVGKTVAANFIQITFGEGTFYLHLEPDVFTNYYLLKKETFPIGFHTVQYLNGKNILWYNEFYANEHEQTPLRFILSNMYLRAAWYLLLVGLLLYLLFKSKRQQRAIPIVREEENKSVEFAKTIGSLYYENGSPGNMLQKKINYFLFDVRKQFQVDTSDLLTPKFIYSISQRTAINSEEVTIFFTTINQLKSKNDCTVAELKIAFQIIEDFKLKAQMI
jgi:hypothetical protein